MLVTDLVYWIAWLSAKGKHARLFHGTVQNKSRKKLVLTCKLVQVTDEWASWRWRHESQRGQHHCSVRWPHRTFVPLADPLAVRREHLTINDRNSRWSKFSWSFNANSTRQILRSAWTQNLKTRIFWEKENIGKSKRSLFLISRLENNNWFSSIGKALLAEAESWGRNLLSQHRFILDVITQIQIQ